VVHQGDAGVEVLMVRRSPSARFMANAWVFPGGVVDPEDHGPEASGSIAGLEMESELVPWLAAAFREVAEETGIWLTDPPIVERLGDEPVFSVAARESRRFSAVRAVYFANWITPTMVPVRFDARFFIVAIDRPVEPLPDETEIDAAVFVPPAEALRRSETGEWLVPFPTQRTLHQLQELSSVEQAISVWRGRRVEPIQPRMRVAADGSLDVVLPDDPGFEDLEDVAPDPEVLGRAARAAAEKGKPIAEVSDAGN
jgi:8-oxo-dGTP pyrophosphatase MutT (NUDIX family)